MKILLTGSSGTIGTRLTEKLLPYHKLIGVDIRENKWKPENNRTTLLVDLRDPDQVETLPRDVDLVIHFAANARVYDLVKEPRLALDNMIINFNVAEFSRTTKGKKIIFASSREVYGNITQEEALTEDRARIENCESPRKHRGIAGIPQ